MKEEKEDAKKVNKLHDYLSKFKNDFINYLIL